MPKRISLSVTPWTAGCAPACGAAAAIRGSNFGRRSSSLNRALGSGAVMAAAFAIAPVGKPS
ncbi:hypothetical protein SSBR45G_71770 [Bradyrhizobium sp. SSBR45G]|nr:hypothetical protein SSBR45G_71770 [Bradyrhizobium sp. SSBR45G]GLH88277.1 hypothetical protein SSBR45R_57380 [Bradyrhizobium sp. SSBR45R]